MRKIFAMVTIFCLLISNIVYAEMPEVSAKSAIIMDVSSGRVLYSKNIDKKSAMASTTKIMTAIVALEKGNLNDIITASPLASRVEGSSIWLGIGEKIKMEDALYGLMLNSGNDAAIAIAEHISGSVDKFAEQMNIKAKEIGAFNTNFKNPNGLDADGHYTTAYDLALITSYGLKNIPKFAEIVKTKKRTIPWEGHEWDRVLKNHNKLLWQYPYADGVKTGFTKKTGRCLVSSATKDGWQIVGVTLSAGDDWNDHKKMFDYAFSTYKPQVIINKEQFMKTIKVNNGKSDNTTLVTANEIKIPLADGESDKLQYKYNIPNYIEAPVVQSQEAGNVEIYIGDEKVNTTFLKPLEFINRKDIGLTLSKIIKSWVTMFDNESLN